LLNYITEKYNMEQPCLNMETIYMKTKCTRRLRTNTLNALQYVKEMFTMEDLLMLLLIVRFV